VGAGERGREYEPGSRIFASCHRQFLRSILHNFLYQLKMYQEANN
jgi:hypothetical protein